MLQQDKTFMKIPLKYTDYADFYYLDLAIELPKNININKHVIELIKYK